MILKIYILLYAYCSLPHKYNNYSKDFLLRNGLEIDIRNSESMKARKEAN